MAQAAQFQNAKEARLHENVALQWVKLRAGDHICQIAHAFRLDVEGVQTISVVYQQVPHVDA